MKAQLTGSKYKAGMATMELLVAFTVLILCISTIVVIAFGNQSTAVDSEVMSEAISKAEKLLEETRAISRVDFNLVNPSTTTESSGPLLYTKGLAVSQVDLFSKETSAIVSWQSGGRTLSTVLTTLLINKDAAQNQTCSSILSGDWKNPQMTNYELGKDLVGDLSSIFPISAVDVYKNKLFISVDNSSAANFPTFFAFNLTDGIAPVFAGSVDNAPTVSVGLSAITISDNYAYVANAYTGSAATCTEGSNCAQLQVINISNPSSPVIVKNVKLSRITTSGKLAAGTSIFYHKDYVYLGLAKTVSGPEFNILDVSNPLNPAYLGGYTIGNGVNSIYVKNNYAYIATPNSENLTVLDVSNPSSPFRVGGYSGAGGSNGKSVAAVGNTAYLGRTFGTDEFFILDTSDPSSVSVIASHDIGTGNKTSINGLAIRDYLAFMITNEKFEVWNIGDPNNIYPWTPSGQVSEFPILPGKGTAMDCEGNFMYVGSLPINDKGFISIITSN